MAYSRERNAVFEQVRNRLFAVAYRMMGTKADAEDIVQEAYLRWHQADIDEVRSPEAWLVSVVTRLSIDRLRKTSVERVKYIGPWLPEPLFGNAARSPEEELELAGILRKSEATCRQVVHRARERVRSERQRFRANERERRELIEKFMAAANAGDELTLLALFKEDATLTSDGGGVVPAARKVVHGRARIARLFLVLARKLRGRLTQTILPINGEPGLVSFLDGAPFSATSFETDGTSILAVYNVLNPEKLKGIGQLGGKFKADLASSATP